MCSSDLIFEKKPHHKLYHKGDTKANRKTPKTPNLIVTKDVPPDDQLRRSFDKSNSNLTFNGGPVIQLSNRKKVTNFVFNEGS